ncbi:hypothetical protein F5B20DRAFT_553740 [Whalleya microplaca]|nr:hypothetical protein F5B20DRAFT_553740 [Whalleya microplaca]
MGNSSSTEAPKRGPRTAQKLTKPRTGNPGTAGLLSPHGLPGSLRHSSSTRRPSLLRSSSALPSPKLPEADAMVMASLLDDKKESEPRNRASRQLSRSLSIQESPAHHQRSQSLGVVPSSQDRRLSRANSLRIEHEGSPNHSQVRIQGNLSRNGSRTSVNYDPSSYESKRLLNLVEEPSHENNSIASANHSQTSEVAWRNSNSRRPSISGTTPAITRDNSETSLYTPMRRKSLAMTPGIATRAARTDSVTSVPRTRYSLPSTPAGRDSTESTSVGATYFPPYAADAEPVPRVVTPCEAEYKQTGVFKLGTLRITNGSPVGSTSHDSNGGERDVEGHDVSPVDRPAKAYLGAEHSAASGNTGTIPCATATEQANVRDANNSSIVAPCPMRVTRGSTPTVVAQQQPTHPVILPQFSPENPLSPLSADGDEMKSLELQTTSKHTAVEDELFEAEDQEYSSAEVLDVRIDPNAKSLAPPPKSTSEGELSRDISRSDSGIVASPSDFSPKHLSKADSGYSSNISLRSFSSSRPPVPEKDHPSESNIEDATKVAVKDTLLTGQSKSTNHTASAPKAVLPKPLREEPPPPVAKDHFPTTLPGPKTSGELSPLSRQNLRFLTFSWAPECTSSSSTNGRGKLGDTRESLGSSPLSPTNSTTFNSTLSIGNASRKAGKLQRLLSGARAPLTVHNIHPVEKEGVPPVPKDVQAKLEERARVLPISFRRYNLKSATSRETLGTILSVGSAELRDTDTPRVSSVPNNNANTSRSGLEVVDRKQVMPAPSIGSTVANAASPVLAKKPITRKPVPIRNKPREEQHESARQLESEEYNSRPRPSGTSHAAGYQSLRREASDSTLAVMEKEKDKYSTSTSRAVRSRTIIELSNGNPKVPFELSRLVKGAIQNEAPSGTSLELPPAISNGTSSRTPPPVSMRTRNKSRASPVPRSHSTPPGVMNMPGGLSLSRRGSREGIHSYPPAEDNLSQHDTAVSKKPSQENMQSYSPTQTQFNPNGYYTAPTRENGRSMSFGSQFREHRVPNWDVQTDHGGPISRQASSDHIRRDSLTRQSSQQNLSSFWQQQPPGSNVQLLRRQSSYDGYSYLPLDDIVQDNGPYPSMSRNGQKYASDPRSGRPMPMSQQWDQTGQYHPHVPRGHHRHRSMEHHSKGAPYRVLHSYNSPAYRNVPIWG